MNYKKIFKTSEARALVLNLVRFVPDIVMLKLQYKIKTGRSLDLKNPKRYTEKIQWYKINYKNTIMRECVDKYKVRNYVQKKGQEDILIQLYAHYNSIQEVEWDKLPSSFVIKTTNGGGGLNVVVCKNKKQLDIDTLKRTLISKKIKARTGGREWAYYGLKADIIIEELLINKENPEAGINDYKIFCYSGKAKYIIVDVDRYIDHKRNFYDIEWNNLHITSDCAKSDKDIKKPKNLEKMLAIAENLSGEFPYVRVDLYNVENKIYFGELTFYPWSGYVNLEPDEFDFILGEEFKLPEIKKEERK